MLLKSPAFHHVGQMSSKYYNFKSQVLGWVRIIDFEKQHFQEFKNHREFNADFFKQHEYWKYMEIYEYISIEHIKFIRFYSN